ncbi:MBL fold metallo-hydrolase [Clostridium transplantifaecale]|uniref:MBL fold metallo-hydrolase n=1 Tax=Clostridium transplantifaecale TaxID=2479838 RepID=UPI000F62F476|nr:MBL fold metallo-hydrolase [Clostridium transplantifaecale]
MSVKFTYFGGMCMLVERSDGFKILCDPYLDKNVLSPVKSPDLYDVDLIMVTHYAGDHLGDAVPIMQNGNATLLSTSDVIYALRKQFELPKERCIASAYGDFREFGITTTHTVYAQHQSKFDMDGFRTYGIPAGFVIEVEPGITYYHTGDTALCNDMKLIRDIYSPNVMCVGIDSVKEKRGSIEMGPREAAMAAMFVGAEVVIPTHYSTARNAPEVFKEHMKSFAPKAIIKEEIGVPFTVSPITVE